MLSQNSATIKLKVLKFDQYNHIAIGCQVREASYINNIFLKFDQYMENFICFPHSHYSVTNFSYYFAEKFLKNPHWAQKLYLVLKTILVQFLFARSWGENKNNVKARLDSYNW